MPEKVLVAERDPHTSMTVASVLEQDGFAVTVAHDALMAADRIRRERPIAAVIASRLAGGSGATVVAAARRSAHAAAIPVVALTSTDGEAEAMIAAGAQITVSHPVNAGALLRAVDAALLAPPLPTVAPAAAIASDGRQASLRRSRLLDTPPEEILDRYTRLIAKLLRAPTALFSVVAADRQFLKSAVAFATPLRFQREIPLEYSLCQWVVSDGSMLVVDDAREHPLLRHNLAVRELGVVAYCGAPIADRFGVVLGSLCAIDDRPHSWTSEDEETLRDLAVSLVADLELHRLRSSA